MSAGYYLPASWLDKPESVQAFTTLRRGGVSAGAYGQYNLASHVGDAVQAVADNRARLRAELQLPGEPVWLEQVHSARVIRLDEIDDRQLPVQADASVCSVYGRVCVVLTADCLPVFFCNQAGTEVAVAHAGWRGLHAGIISHTLKAMHSPVSEIQVSLGPAIGPQFFEVGAEVFHAFVAIDKKNQQAFVASSEAHYLCDIYQLARLELQSAGVDKISGGEHCTYRDHHDFYSYRRQPTTGRMASLIWLSPR